MRRGGGSAELNGSSKPRNSFNRKSISQERGGGGGLEKVRMGDHTLKYGPKAVVVVQLVERLLPIPEIRGSNNVIDNVI